jgi:mRNA-degrading endonuclease RelE of RelBE toxin-antitoxin system
MQKIEIVRFKEYFIKSFDKLEDRLKVTFFKKIEILENKDYISKRLHYKEHICEMRYFRIGKFRFIFVLKDNTATFLDVMYRELDYKDKYLNLLLEIYKNGK